MLPGERVSSPASSLAEGHRSAEAPYRKATMFGHRTPPGKMIDMHCHVLPALDDGSQSMEQTLGMLRIAQREGIEAMIVTPHYKQGHHNASPERILERIGAVREAALAEEIDIPLYPGNEILYYDGVEEVLSRDGVHTLNGTDRVLVEFYPNVEYLYLRGALDSIRAEGYIPVLAHVERYECMVKDASRVRELVGLDAEIQINASSAAGKLGRGIRHFLYGILDEELVTYVGTDAHNTDGRAPEYRECYQALAKRLPETYLREIFYENALTIIEAE